MGSVLPTLAPEPGMEGLEEVNGCPAPEPWVEGSSEAVSHLVPRSEMGGLPLAYLGSLYWTEGLC